MDQPTLRDAMQAVSGAETIGTLPVRMRNVVANLDSDTLIHPLLKNDVIHIMTCVLALAEAACDDSYPVDSVTDNVAQLMQTAANILAHTTHNRPALYGYGVEHQGSRSLLATVFRTRQDAEDEIKTLREFGSKDPLRVVPIRISSQIVNRPTANEVRLITEPQLPPVIPQDQFDHAPNVKAFKTLEKLNHLRNLPDALPSLQAKLDSIRTQTHGSSSDPASSSAPHPASPSDYSTPFDTPDGSGGSR